MADPRTLTTALAPFHAARTHLEAAQARLSALLAAVTGEAAARTGNLERLPAAARFNPFAVAVPFNPFAVLPKVFDAANGADAAAKARGRHADKGSRAAPGATARPSASASAALAGLASAADSLAQAPRRAPDLPPSAAALAAAAANAQARAAAAEPLASRPASEQAVHALAAGELIEALLQRHAPPRAATRLHGIGARSAPARDDGDAARARHTAAASAAGAAQAAADRPAARREAAIDPSTAAARGAVLAPGGEYGDAPPSRLHAASAPWGERAAMATASGIDAAPVGAPALQHGDAVLRSLLDSVPPRPARAAQALDGIRPEPLARAPTRSPLQRAPSRLLAAVGTAPAAQPPAAAAASLHAPTQVPAGSASGDNAADLADGLERLLREQAWLRGVDLT
ncbi:hypothetical protein [Thauera sp.]|jgi:hypothetical protein|uniref:hypothetical protein n=1 Tax=Thauera sp. TaxID=1905334 RepID=UPI002A372529|nr:hypothetical protein [Thauera sp.]MDX9885491.1 hypothetical protein [Thauera sp.]